MSSEPYVFTGLAPYIDKAKSKADKDLQVTADGTHAAAVLSALSKLGDFADRESRLAIGPESVDAMFATVESNLKALDVLAEALHAAATDVRKAAHEGRKPKKPKPVTPPGPPHPAPPAPAPRPVAPTVPTPEPVPAPAVEHPAARHDVHAQPHATTHRTGGK